MSKPDSVLIEIYAGYSIYALSSNETCIFYEITDADDELVSPHNFESVEECKRFIDNKFTK